jgi:hypothetical protein
MSMTTMISWYNISIIRLCGIFESMTNYLLQEDASASRHSGAARQWIASPGKALLYADRPPLRAAPAADPAHQLPLWEREERERQDFLFKVTWSSTVPVLDRREHASAHAIPR